MEAPRKRPIILTIICILGILWSMGNFVSVFSPAVKKISDWAPALYGIMVALQFISFVGVWHMKRWGVLLFIAAFFSKLIFALFTEDISYIGTPLGIIFIVHFLVYYKRMADEL